MMDTVLTLALVTLWSSLAVLGAAVLGSGLVAVVLS